MSTYSFFLYMPALTGRERAELVELVLVVLFLGRDAGINRNVHAVDYDGRRKIGRF